MLVELGERRGSPGPSRLYVYSTNTPALIMYEIVNQKGALERNSKISTKLERFTEPRTFACWTEMSTNLLHYLAK